MIGISTYSVEPGFWPWIPAILVILDNRILLCRGPLHWRKLVSRLILWIPEKTGMTNLATTGHLPLVVNRGLSACKKVRLFCL